MGVHGLTGLLKRYAPQSVKNVHVHMFANQTIAFDASCHLNRFIYGDDSHSHRHIYGFYMLARFCQRNAIKPIFVFDGPVRIAAKQLESMRRERTRFKVKHALQFEKARAARLQAWMDVSDVYRNLSETATSRIREQLEEAAQPQDAAQLLDTTQLQDMTSPTEPHVERWMAIARDLREALAEAHDQEKYTRTVRELSVREYNLMSDMLRERLNDFQPALSELEKDNRQTLSSLVKRSIRITQALRDECQTFLRMLGFVCLTSYEHEAEAMCARLTQEGRANAVVSEDLDTIVFGDAPMLRYFFARNHPILCIDPVAARKALHLTRDAFMDMCILCGTDFSGTIRGIGPNRALQFIQRYGSIEGVLEHLKHTNHKRHVPDAHFDPWLARKVFRHLPAIPMNDEAYQPQRADKALVNEILHSCNIDVQEVEARLDTIQLQERGTQNTRAWGPDPFASPSS